MFTPLNPSCWVTRSRPPTASGASAQRGDVQPLVDVAEAEVLGLALVQRGAERRTDVGADESDAVAGVVDREDHYPKQGAA